MISLSLLNQITKTINDKLKLKSLDAVEGNGAKVAVADCFLIASQSERAKTAPPNLLSTSTSPGKWRLMQDLRNRGDGESSIF